MQAGVLFLQSYVRFVITASLPPSKHCDLLVLLTIIYATGSAGSTSSKQTSDENKMLELLREQRCSFQLLVGRELSNKGKI